MQTHMNFCLLALGFFQKICQINILPSPNAFLIECDTCIDKIGLAGLPVTLETARELTKGSGVD